MKALLLTGGSLMLSASVIANAYFQKKQFYPSVVYITKSNPSMAVLYLQAFVFVILMGKVIRKVFFGQLRAAEMEHLIERSWYAVTETCLAFTVFRDDFSPRFVALFTLLLFLKCFHWLAEDRVDYMERSPIISLLFHLRAIALLAFLGSLDGYFINHAYYSTLIKGASVQLVFGFEYAILLTMVLTVFVKYILHTIDLQSENPWESKAVYMLYTDLVLGFIKVILYLLFLVIMIKVHTFPLFAIRPMYLTMRAFKKALSDVIMSRRAIRNMNTLYPDATEEDLASGDNVCIICREEMVSSCKKLPCNHIFHTNCLRSWFQRQQTCPTCRMDVLRQPALRRSPQPQLPQQQAQQGFAGAGLPGAFGLWLPGQQVQQQQPTQAGINAASTETNSSPINGIGSTAQTAMPPFMMMPPFPFMPPFGMPPPVPPSELHCLTEAELSNVEGMERRHLQARVQWLRDIHAALDSAMLQIQQYTQLMNSYGLHQGFTWQDDTVHSSPNLDTVKKPNKFTNADTIVKVEKSKRVPRSSSHVSEATDTEQENGHEKSKSLDKVESNDDDSEELREIRKRRLARFTSQGLSDNDMYTEEQNAPSE